MDAQVQKPEVGVNREGGTLFLELSGCWRSECGLPGFNDAVNGIADRNGCDSLAIRTSKVTGWDSGLMTFIINALEYCRSENIEFDRSELLDDLRKLLDLSQAVPKKDDAQKSTGDGPFFERLGNASLRQLSEAGEMVSFVGECFVSVTSLLRGRSPFRWKDFFVVLQEVGANALVIVTLISFLVGLIIAFLGAVVLLRFGAAYYVSYLVAYGVMREMGSMMTGVIMAGRTGAAFAAQIGSMKVSEEIDALRTLGISPIDFIVLPRMLALFLMMPLLVVYADIIGMLGGGLVSYFMLDIGPNIFMKGMTEAVALPDFYLGMIKAVVFGVIVAVTGCLRGMQCGNSADAVGMAATSAVVTGITMIIFANALIDWIAAVYGI